MVYRWYRNNGDEVSSEDVVQTLAKVDVVLFGELHGNSCIHRLQQHIAGSLFESRKHNLAFGSEMFEADNQLILDEYLSGHIKHRHLVAEAKVWDGYETDYRPLVRFAKQQGLRFVATNIPRRYANLVAREGLGALEQLSDEAKRFIAPLPIAVDLQTPGYQEMLRMNMGHGMGMAPENFVAAQAIKDATMAHFILKNLPPAGAMLHFNGDYHSRRYGGIYWYLRQADKNLSLATIASVAQESQALRDEYRELGDFILIVAKG